MGAEMRARSLPPGAEATPAPQRALATDVRAAAARAAELVGGGIAVVFATPARDGAAVDCALRAAAGFGSAAEARAAAGSVLPRVREALARSQSLRLAPGAPAGARATGGGVVHPLLYDDRIHGALVVAWSCSPAPEVERAIEALARDLAARFDHARLALEASELRAKIAQAGRGHDERAEEILKLSEALFAQDIELLRSNEKLGKIEKLKNDFIEKMSRELRTPLNRIIEAIISVLTGEHDALSETSKAGLRAALDDGTAFLRTLQNILDLWRLKQGELPVEIQDVNFRETVAEAIFSVQDSIGEKPLAIETRIDDAFPKIRTDLTKISQILFLLLDNAVKFTPRGRVEIVARVEGESLHCQVRDTGIGICPDDRQYIFDEFFQLAEPSSRRYQGAGLGLTLVRDLLTLLGGEIAVSSEIGSGSTFAFSVPVQVVG